MKKFLGILAFGALFALAEPAAAQAVDDHSIGTNCLVEGAEELDLTQGGCASFYGTFALDICTIDLGGVPFWAFVGYPNQGQCVADVTRQVRAIAKDGLL